MDTFFTRKLPPPMRFFEGGKLPPPYAKKLEIGGETPPYMRLPPIRGDILLRHALPALYHVLHHRSNRILPGLRHVD